jgi:signal transduction histidine kinase
MLLARHDPGSEISSRNEPSETPMFRKLMIGAFAGAAMVISSSAFAQGTAAEAKAMLEKAVAAVKADKAKAIEMFNKGEGGFKDRDLYVFCFNAADGKVVATQAANRIGMDVRTNKDASGKMFGEDLCKAAQDGKFNEVSYMFPKPGATEPSPKLSLVTKVGDLGCGVGYYK